MMALQIGNRLGSYEITAHIGVGGMGEVYRARDTNRDVALKVVPEAFTRDSDRLARFKREAQVLASLNHPNIGAIYGFEESNGTQALVLELVEGPTLADRIAQGQLPLDEVLPIAKQIADSLEAAHEQGIIHRDLKPANIKVRPDGAVKVLDFGLAKAFDPAGPPTAATIDSPTLTARATQLGMILGTAAYMAPEQARGRPVDRRADIWAFGVVLYEMLTGRRAFDGDDISITLAAVLKDRIDWSALPLETPTAVRRLLRRCLEKDPRRRLGSMGDARLELDDATSSPHEEALVAPAPAAGSVPRATTRWAPWIVAAVASVVATTSLVFWPPSRTAEEPIKVAFELHTPEEGVDVFRANQFALSPDGRAFVGRAGLGGRRIDLRLRPLDRPTGSSLAGTDGGTYPFWSPDSRFIGFFAEEKLKTLDTTRGGTPQSIADAPQAIGGTWNRNGTIVFAPSENGPLFSVSASGGQAVQVLELDRSRGDVSHRHPLFLPDGEHFLYLAQNSNGRESAIYAGALNSKETKRIIATTGQPLFFPPDRLLFLRGSALMAQRFDLTRMELVGNPVEAIASIAFSPVTGTVAAKVSSTGVLASRTGLGGRLYLTWFDRNGKPGTMVGSPDAFENPRLSPDGMRVAVFTCEPGGDIWIFDLERGSSVRLTDDPAVDNDPLWSPDGSRIAFVSNRDGGVFNIYQKGSGGADEDEVLLLKTSHNKRLNDWSADGRYILYQEDDPTTRWDLWVLPLFGDRKPQLVLGTRSSERQASFSPDGHWIAYTADEGSNAEVYVQPFPPTGMKWHISTNAGSGSRPRWRADGRELFFDSSGLLMSVDLAGTVAGKPLKASTPQMLFRGLPILTPAGYDLSPGGDRFLVLTTSDPTSGFAPIVIETNWMPPK